MLKETTFVDPEISLDKEDVVSSFQKYLNLKGKTISKGTATVYNTTIKHLKDFCTEQKEVLTWDLFDRDFEYKWNNYFIDKNICISTSRKYIKTLKIFLGWSAEKGYFNSSFYKRYKVENRVPDIFPYQRRN